MGEPRMARIDVVLHLGKKAGKVKEEKYLYSIFSKDFPKGPGNPVYGSGEVKDTTANRMALQCLVDALQRIHRPSLYCAVNVASCEDDCLSLGRSTGIPRYTTKLPIEKINLAGHL